MLEAAPLGWTDACPQLHNRISIILHSCHYWMNAIAEKIKYFAEREIRVADALSVRKFFGLNG